MLVAVGHQPMHVPLFSNLQELNPELAFSKHAIDAICHAADDYLTRLNEDTILNSIHSYRTLIYPKDLQLARRVRGERA